MLFEGFEVADIATPRGRICVRVGGRGAPLLVLHGYPESHLMWHAVAPRLAERFTVIAADLPGYGDSYRPPVAVDHASHSKRAMAEDLLAAMRALGHAAFALAGHDRGGRVGYRMALDHPEAVTRLAALDIVPTGESWSRADWRFALGYWHWSFLAQPAPFPERMILGDPDAFWGTVERLGIKDDERYPAEVRAAYRAQCRDPAAVQAICEDYRAGASVDRDLDDADRSRRTIGCPLLALWGADGALPRFYEETRRAVVHPRRWRSVGCSTSGPPRERRSGRWLRVVACRDAGGLSVGLAEAQQEPATHDRDPAAPRVLVDRGAFAEPATGLWSCVLGASGDASCLE